MRGPSDIALEAAEDIFRTHGGVMRTSEALEAGIHRRTLYWMRDEGMLETLSRGVFSLASSPLPASPDVAAVVRRVPSAVVCLVSALAFHEIGTQIPHAVDIALPRTASTPKIQRPRIRVFHMSEAALRAGVETHDMSGTQVKVFGIAKTAADCFKYRNKIGMDVAIEALQEIVRTRRASPAQIMEYAEIDRVAKVVGPYLQALL